MPTFNAGAIEATATLKRDEFIAGLDEISAKADEFSRKKITPLVEIQNIGKVRGQLDQINNRLDKLSKQKASPAVNLKMGTSAASLDKLSAKLDDLAKRKVRPDVDLGGVAATGAQLTALKTQLDRLDREKATPKVTVDTQDGERGLKRLLDGILALAPALAPLGAATVGGAVGLAGAFTAAGAGAGAFALAAVPAIKKVASAEDALQTAVQSRTAAQKTALDGLTTGEEQAARKLQGLVQTYHGFSDALEPTTFTVLAKGAGIASDALHDIAPVAHTTGQALSGLEDKAKTALDSKFYKTFFDYLGVEAPRSVSTFGRSLGNVGTGFAGVLQAFTPVEHQLEDGILHLSQKFADFGKGAGSNTGVQEFIAYIEKEGPVAVHLIGQFGSTFATVAKDAAPLGAIELKIVSGLLQFIDAEAKAHPKLIELALGVYTVNKAVSALKLTALVSGTAGAGRSLIGIGTGVAGIALGTKSVAGVFPRVASAAGKIGLAATGARVGMLQLGEAFGGAEATGIILTGGLAALAAGVGVLGYEMTKNGTPADQFVKNIIKVNGATGNNIKGYQNAEKALKSYIKAQENTGAYKGGYNPYGATANYETANANVATAAAAFNKLTKQQQNVITGTQKVQKVMGALGPTYKLSAKQADALASANKIDLSKGFDLSTKAGQKNAAALAYLVAQTKEHIAEVKLSHDPTAQFAADVKLAGDKAQTAAQQQTGFNNAISLYQDLTSATIASAAQVGTAISGLAGDFTKGTTAAERNGAAATILSGNYSKLVNSGPQTKKFAGDLSSLQGTFSQTYEQMFKTASESGHTAKGFQDVSSAAKVNEKALQGQLEKMGLSASAAKQLADKFAGVPKDITTKAHLVGVEQVEGDAAGMRKKILDIPLGHTTTAKADIASAQRNLDALKSQVAHLPKSAKIKGEADISAAQGALDTLESHIYELTHKKWSVSISADGSVQLPSLSHGPVATPGMARGGTLKPAGMAWVGERGPELIQVQTAARVYPHQQSMQIANSIGAPIPGFASGGLIDITARSNAGSLVPAVDGLSSQLSSAQKYAKSLAASMGNYKAGAGVSQWSSTVLKALSIMHQPASLLPVVLRRMNQESGGNPKAINLTDSNAKAGDPSRGLMQDIMATFQSFHYPGTSSNIYDPLANILASMQYALAEYGSLASAYNRAGGYAQGGNPSRGELAWVGEQGPELVRFNGPATVYNHEKSLQMAGLGVPGYASGGKVIPTTTFKTSQGFTGAGDHLLDVILSSLTGNRARSAIQQVDNSIIHSIDADFTGATRSGLVGYTQKVNQQMLGLATARDRIASKLAAANELSTSVTSGAKSFADISQFTALGSNNLLKEFHSKLAAINQFDSNIAKMKSHGFSSELIAELVAAGIDQAAPIAAQLAKARPAQVHQFNATQRSVDRAAKKLGTVAVNAQFGTSAAHSFVASLRSQQNSLERQMQALAKVFAHGVGHAFHLKGYAAGGHPSAGELAVVGERGPELVQFSANATVHPGMQVGGSSADPGEIAGAVAVAVSAALAGARFQMTRNGWRIITREVSKGQKINAVRGPA